MNSRVCVECGREFRRSNGHVRCPFCRSHNRDLRTWNFGPAPSPRAFAPTTRSHGHARSSPGTATRSHQKKRAAVRPPNFSPVASNSGSHWNIRGIVEVQGFEPWSFGTFPVLLRAQPALLFSAPAITQARRRRAQSLFDFLACPVTGLASLAF